ncbi:MAG: hypothetical protein OCD02_20065 [Spirochaetaceae bacterium]
MKLSNKVLLGGFCVPIILFVILVVYMTINGTDDTLYQIGANIDYQNVNF